MTLGDRYLEFRPDFAKVIDTRFYTIEWLDAQIFAGLANLWASDDAAIVAELKRYPAGGLELHGLVAAGNKETIIETLIPAAETWGKERGCIVASIASRSGWQRALKASGYELHQTVVRKELI